MGMGSQVYKHFYQEFKTRFKVFLFNLDNRGGHVRITERNRNFSVTTDFNLEVAFWILESVRAAIFHGKQGVFRKIFKGSHCKIIMDTGRNCGEPPYLACINTGTFKKATATYLNILENANS